MTSRSAPTIRGIRARGPVAIVLASLAGVATAASPAAAHRAQSDPAAQTRRFIENRRINLRRDARGMAELRRVLSTPFYRPLSAAFEEDRQFQLLHPDDKPGHIEFTFICSDGSFDGYEIGPTRFHSATSASVVVSFHDLYNGGTDWWTDRYEWVREQGGWRLDEIECEIDHPDRRHSLRRSLGH